MCRVFGLWSWTVFCLALCRLAWGRTSQDVFMRIRQDMGDWRPLQGLNNLDE